MSKKLEIMDEIMNVVAQTDEWNRIQREDPDINATEQELRDLAARICSAGSVPAVLFSQLSDTIAHLCCAYSNAAILYGIQVGTAIHTVSEHPETLSYHVMKRISRLRTDE